MDIIFDGVLSAITNFFQQAAKNADQIIIIIIKIILVLLLAKSVIFIFRRVIKKIMNKNKNKRPFSSMARKSKTIEMVSFSAARYIVYFLAAVSVLDILGMGATVGSLLAAAGIGGIAVGIGAQSFIKDAVTGLFILIEDQYSVGEYIETGDEKGTVEAITIRTTRIRRFTGEITTLPNGSIEKVTNYSRGDVLAVVDIPAPLEADVGRVSEIMRQKGLEYMAEHDNILEEPHVLGITEFLDSAAVIRMILRVKPLTHWETERALRRLIQEELVRQEIGMPYPRRVVVGG